MKITPRTLLLGVLLLLFITACSGSTDSWPGIAKVDNGGNAVIVSYKRIVVSLDADKNRKWTYPGEDDRDANFFAQAVVQDGRVYIGDYKGRVHAIDEETGRKIWIYEPERSSFLGFEFGSTDRVIGAIALAGNDTLFFGNEHGVQALDISGENPREKWSFETEHSVWGQPFYLDDDSLGIEPTLFVTSLDKYLYALNPDNGEVRWKVELNGSIPDRVLLDSKRKLLYASTLNGEVVAISLVEKAVVATYEAEGWVWSVPVLFSDKLYFGDLKGWLYEVELTDDEEIFGRVAKRQLSKEPLRASPLIVEDREEAIPVLVIGSEDGKVYALDLTRNNWITSRDEELRWEKEVEGRAVSNLTWLDTEDHRLVIIGTEEDERLVIALRLDDGGDRAWSYKYDD